MKLIADLGTRKDSKGRITRYGLFFCGHCETQCEKRYRNGLRAKSCGCTNVNKRYERGRKYVTRHCEVCGSLYEQQYRLFAKAKWKSRCPEHRKEMKKADGDWVSVSELKPGNRGVPNEQCRKCGKKIWGGSTHCKSCAQKGISKDGTPIQQKHCAECGKKISRQANNRCLRCWNKKQDLGLSRERTKFTLSKAWASARSACFERDIYTCQHCGARSRKGQGRTVILNAHHIVPYRTAPHLRLELSNLVTLCDVCHVEVHRLDTGEDRANTKLNMKDVTRIKELIEEGMHQRDIAKIFSISQSTVSHIASGRTWAHVSIASEEDASNET